MSKCDISVEFDEPDRVYAPGEVGSGKVRVSVDDDCRCDGLTLEQGWRTHGRGNGAGVVTGSDVVFRGEWKAGEEHVYPFDFTVADGPYSYHGHYLNVDWYVRATADIPWALDPKDTADFLVGPGPETDPTTYINRDDVHRGINQTRETSRMIESGCFGIFALAMLFVGVGAMGVGYFGGHSDGKTAGIIVGAFITVFALAMGYRVLRNRFAAGKLGEVDVSLPDGFLTPGQQLPVHVELAAAVGDALNGVSAELICAENCVAGSGTNRRTYTDQLHHEQVDLVEQSSEAGRLRLGATFELPEDAELSFYADDNSLTWLVRVHVDVARWPDWKRDHYVEVRPAPVGAQAPAAELEDGAVW